MATVNKNFKVKHGLVVEGTTGTINGEDILTKKQEDIDYILAEVGGSGVSENTPDTLVLRDANGNFAAGTITADIVGTVSDISNHDTDALIEGATNKYYSTTQAKADAATLLTSATQTNISITGDENGLTITAENGVDDSTTDDLDEGATNQYFTDTRAREAVSAGDGLDYNSTSGIFSADLGNGLQIDGTGQIEIDNNVVATQTDLSTDIGTHSDATSGVHGVTGDVVGTVDAQTLTNKDLGSGTTLSANLDANGFTVTGLGTPTDGTDAVTKQYVDGLSAGLTWKAAVNLLSSTNVSLTGTDGTLVIDGHSALDSNDVGYRLLLTGQTASTENGIYNYTVSGGSYTLTRSADADSDAELHGAAVFVMEGTTYGSTSWIQVNHYVASFANQEWDQFSGAGTYIAGNGLSLTGNEFSIDTDVTATKSYVDEEIDAHTELTTAHGVAGDIVGTSDTQTLTNKTLGSGTVLGADLDGTNTYKVVNLVDPTSNQDAATKKYVDDEITSVNGAIDELTTDDIEEGVNNLYHTDVRAKTSAANLLTGASLTNITITGDETGLTITAENGVADSTTSDLAEGTNLYFTNQRALDATAAAYDVVGAAATAEGNANDYTDTEIGDLTTDDIEEGETNLYFTNQRALDATAAAYDVVGSGAGALEQANDYTDGEITTALTTAQGYADTAEADAKAYADDLIGDATVDGTSGNTVTARIASAVSNLVDSAPETLDTLNELAAALQDNPDIISDLQDIAAGKQDTLTAGDNIDITDAIISVTGLDTDDVSEGTNLYFTDERAVDALEAVVPNFTEVDINSVATQVAATGSATGSTANTVYSFAKADYRSAKFLVKVAYSTHTEISEVLLTLDTSDNIAITEYAIVGTNGSLSTVSAEVSGANVNLLVTPANTSTVTVMGTLLA
jgi:hypothetical protein